MDYGVIHLHYTATARPNETLQTRASLQLRAVQHSSNVKYRQCVRGVASDYSDAGSNRAGGGAGAGEAIKPICRTPSAPAFRTSRSVIPARRGCIYVSGLFSSSRPASRWQPSGPSGKCANSPAIKRVNCTPPPRGE